MPRIVTQWRPTDGGSGLLFDLKRVLESQQQQRQQQQLADSKLDLVGVSISIQLNSRLVLVAVVALIVVVVLFGVAFSRVDSSTTTIHFKLAPGAQTEAKNDATGGPKSRQANKQKEFQIK